MRELRVQYDKAQYRVLYQRSDNLVVLLNAFEKKTQKLPRAEIQLGAEAHEGFPGEDGGRAAGAHRAPRAETRR